MQHIELSNIYKNVQKNRDIFHKLMVFKVKNVLLVATHYDAYNIIKEEQLTDKIYGTFLKLNLYSNPQLLHASTEDEALKMLDNHPIDLVILMAGLNKKHPISISKKIKLQIPSIPILLLVNNNADIAYFESIKHIIKPYIHKIFVWNGSSRIFMAMIKYIEDIYNLSADVKIGDVRIILLVEDSIQYYSRYLPILYMQLMLQTQALVADEKSDLNEMEQITQIRARPKLMLRSSYESALETIDKYSNNLLGLITDIEFYKQNVKDSKAGVKLVKYVKENNIDCPIVIQSTDNKNAIYASKFNVNFINKMSKTLSSDVQNFLKLNLGFGNFVYHNFSGTKIYEAHTLEEFEKAFYTMPDEVILYHAQRDDFSKWLLARGEIYMAKRFRRSKVENFDSIEDIRNLCINIFKNSRIKQIGGTIVPFRPTLIPYSDKFILKIGKGSLGGKGRGIAFISNFMEGINFNKLIPNIRFCIPKTTIIGTEEFDNFIELNNLHQYIYSKINYTILKEKFLSSSLPEKLVQKLYQYLSLVKTPLIVRSSGLFEDSINHPFAGVYSSYFLTNNDTLENRLKQIEKAIKMVYASIYTNMSADYFKAIGYKIEEEKMAIIIQELVGNVYNDKFYPHISGIAQSYNFYPFSYIKPKDGFSVLCVGLGNYVTGGENAFRICPQYPKLQQMSIRDQMKNSQQHFYALDMQTNEVKYSQNGVMVGPKKYKIAEAENDGNLIHFASVYDYQNNRLEADLSLQGPRIINFSNILNYDYIPLAKTLQVVLELFRQAMDSPIEIEFAVDILNNKMPSANFYLLQIRPLILHSENISFNIENIDKKRILLYSTKSIGNGKINDIKDIIYVDINTFDKTKTEEMSKEVEYFNNKLQKQDKNYILIGPGRWGTKDRFTGIPIAWSQISNAKVIVEHDLSEFPIEGSLGAHFFHNVTSMNIGYLTVTMNSKDCIFNYQKLSSLPVLEKLKYFRHVQFKNELSIFINGKKQKTVIYE